nr:MAG TPA: hypothetical protein [Caudoviricetes sp.]
MILKNCFCIRVNFYAKVDVFFIAAKCRKYHFRRSSYRFKINVYDVFLIFPATQKVGILQCIKMYIYAKNKH